MNRIIFVFLLLGVLPAMGGCGAGRGQVARIQPAQITIEWDSTTLRRLAPMGNRQLRYAGYPRIKRFGDGNIVGIYEADGHVESVRSTDEGLTWSEPDIVFKAFTADGRAGGNVRVNMANPEIIELANGHWVAACNYRPRADETVPFSIAVSRSIDQGRTWSEPQVVFNAEPRFKDGCWEPALLQLPDGTLQLYFANEKPYTASDEQEISVLESNDQGVTWADTPRTVSFRAGKRDGMPVPLLLDHEIAVVIEDNKDGQFKPYIVRSSIADNWRTPVLGESPRRTYALADSLPVSVYAGAPYIARLASGEVIMSYQTTEGRGAEWEKSTMEVAIGDRDGRNFRKVPRPFDVPLDRAAKWNSVSLWNDTTVVAVSASNLDGANTGAWMILGKVIVE